MRSYRSELWLAGLVIGMVTLAYVLVTTHLGAVPSSGSPTGRTLGLLGLMLMLMTQTAYSARKRSRQPARWGNMEFWLRAHVLTGMVGIYVVLLHGFLRFNGLAGIVALLMLLIVVSGLVGRYIYTAMPRTAFQRRTLAFWYFVHVPLGLTLLVLAFIHIGAAAYYAMSAR